MQHRLPRRHALALVLLLGALGASGEGASRTWECHGTECVPEGLTAGQGITIHEGPAPIILSECSYTAAGEKAMLQRGWALAEDYERCCLLNPKDQAEKVCIDMQDGTWEIDLDRLKKVRASDRPRPQ